MNHDHHPPRIGDNVFTRLPRGIGALVAVLSGCVGLSALAGAAGALLTPSPTWFLFGFEVVTVVAAVFGVLVGVGRYSTGPGLATLCVAGAIGAGAMLGYVGAGKELFGMDLMPFVMARVAAAAVIAAVGGFSVLMRRPRVSMPRLLVGLACGAGAAGIGAIVWIARSTVASAGVMVQAVVGLVAFSVLLGLVAAAVHQTIAAFESGDVDHAGPGRGS